MQDTRDLAGALREAIDGEVRFSPGDRALYATDASNYRQDPIGVVIPRHVEDVIAAVEVCRGFDVPLLSRGAGTSLAGQCCNTAVILDLSKYVAGVTALDPGRGRARVLPGTVLDRLRAQARPHGLTFGPDPATHTHCTLGGMIGNNSCGPHSVIAGRTMDNVEQLEILTYQGQRLWVGATSEADLERIVQAGGPRGEIYRELRALRDRYADLIRARFPQIPRRVSGYNLDELLPERGFHVARALVGSEGTCVTVLEAELRLVPWDRCHVLLLLGFVDVFVAAAAATGLVEQGATAVEGLDSRLVQFVYRKGLDKESLALFPEGNAYLLVEFGGEDAAQARQRARRAADRARHRGAATDARIFEDAAEQLRVWNVRESGLGATARVPGERDAWPGWEDSAVPPDRLSGYLRDLRRLLDEHGYSAALYGHFGQGCVHCRIDFDLSTAPGVVRYRRFMEAAADLVVSYGGSLSGEHGDGQARAELLDRMYGPELVQAFRRFKRIWDPRGRMNPGKLVDPYRIDQNLRIGPGTQAARPPTLLRYPDDDGRLDRGALRCVGVGKCRREDGGTMCPSYMVLKEEKHSTRGRAHLLHEMLRGEILRDGWDSREVFESLDLCLACKGCKGDCPMHVDVATYKAEFMAHHYRHRRRPRTAYLMGLIAWWARMASLTPGLINLLARAAAVGPMLKWAAGIARERQLPAFAGRTFRHWFREHPPDRSDGAPVLLWPDTFNNHFFPGTAAAAVRVLEAAGYRVSLPPGRMCCGRPLYDSGMLRLARRWLKHIVDELSGAIARGVPLVVLEPSCLSVFRDEIHQLLPDDPRARRLSALAVSLPELLARHPETVGWRAAPALGPTALVHGHCHEKALWGQSASRQLLQQAGLEPRVVDSGCCGMAGAFGFEAGQKYQISIAAGERRLLPAVRAAGDETVIVADGFSCREQIRQQTGRVPRHTAEVLSESLVRSGTDRRPHPHGGRLEPARLQPWKPGMVAALAGGMWIAGRAVAARRPRSAWRRLLVSQLGQAGTALLSLASAALFLGAIIDARPKPASHRRTA